MHWLSNVSVRRPIFATVLVALVVVFGLFGSTRLGVDRFPDVDFPVVSVITRLPGAAPKEVESDISMKIEEAVNTVSGIDELRSISNEGVSQVYVTFELEKDIDAVRYKLGERNFKEEHLNAVRVGNVAKGQWMRLPLDSDVNYLVTEIGKNLDPNWYAGRSLKSFDEAPRVPIAGKGQLVFQNKCAACHSIGKGERLAPDLKDVAVRRERAWLARYLAAPEKMRAANDPIALELAKHAKVPMPNLGLTRNEVMELIDYLEGLNRPHP